MTIQIPESLSHDLERLAAERRITAQQLALDRLRLGGRPVEHLLRPSPPGSDQPGDAVALWRYMNLGRFLSMLWGTGDPQFQSGRGALYFSRIREFPDSYEGAHPSVYGLYPADRRQDCKRLYDWVRLNAAVSCWHEGDDESVAMWRLYTAGVEGVAIKTTVAKLTRSIQADRLEFRVARVFYIGDSESLIPCLDRMPDGLEAIYCKRLVYQHEREVRAALIPNRTPGALQIERDLCCGFRVGVDLPTLLGGVVVSEPLTVPVVEEALNRAGIHLKVVCSAINRRPHDTC